MTKNAGWIDQFRDLANGSVAVGCFAAAGFYLMIGKPIGAIAAVPALGIVAARWRDLEAARRHTTATTAAKAGISIAFGAVYQWTWVVTFWTDPQTLAYARWTFMTLTCAGMALTAAAVVAASKRSKAPR